MELCAQLIICASAAGAEEVADSATASKETSAESKQTAGNVKMTSLKGEAIILQEEAAKVDKVVKDFASHGQAYQESSLHKSVLQGGVSKNEDAGGENAGIPGHAKNVHALHSEYAAHVAQLKAMVDQYRTFYQAYAAHFQQYKGHLNEYNLEAQQAKLGELPPQFNLSATKSGQNLLAAETELANVLKKMFALQQESPNLPESVLCPAYDDLKVEFAKATQNLGVSVQALPKYQVQVVAQTEVTQIMTLKQEMDHADALHVEQLSLQSEFSQLQKSFSEVNKLHGELVQDK